ncbi:hypothetical protein OHS33_33535 [Streptomyces sp. NBC_00536]|uniref:hypothetical protein n=1 Tax=Streptomyces sp. NBC_00536 TaxID=2975769 RepID=UPI002E81D031|nr:hypothetical protein [Streptomyces sp. NBC_00536]WUC82855.1 hypothetical protein OHS33_33535 [Streptomyces sp. NBC_00536]
MTRTPSPTAPAPLRRRPARVLVRGGAVLLVAVLVQGCALVQGHVMSETEFRTHLERTQRAGDEAARQLGLNPSAVVDRHDMSNSSCKDDLGLDAEGVSRDQPSVTWTPDFASPAAYATAVATLREAWSAKGLTVRDIPAPDAGERGAGLPGIRTTDDHGVELSLRPGWFSGKPELVADGGCVRHEGALVSWK